MCYLVQVQSIFHGKCEIRPFYSTITGLPLSIYTFPLQYLLYQSSGKISLILPCLFLPCPHCSESLKAFPLLLRQKSSMGKALTGLAPAVILLSHVAPHFLSFPLFQPYRLISFPVTHTPHNII